MDKGLWRRMLNSMFEEEVDLVHQIAWEILNQRTKAKVETGEYPSVSEKERSLLSESYVEVIRAYKNRAGVSLRVAKYVIDFEREKEEMKRKEKKERKCVHTEHCCVNCGCKYGDEDCPVVLGLKKQSNPCGQAYTCAEGW